ncbi:MAG: hypothetical protein EBR01_00935 [Proteobacteria bacterium]|nr:hypothetical protein [Pseudomonadota bacterium]NBY19083.1 hypothetical protein [bacterium]
MIKLKVDDSACSVSLDTMNKIGTAITEAINGIPSNRLVTQLLVDGIRYNAEKQAEILEKSIDSSHEIEIKTADKAIWAATGYDISLSCIERIQRSIIKTAELFRESDKLNGNRLFIQCIEGLERFIEAITITKAAIGLDFTKELLDGRSLSQTESDLNIILKSVFSFQEQEDYQGLADKIEYELLTNLSEWGRALNQLRARQNSNA